ncbi:MAG: SH3 domain-containing protein [Cyanobacteria bacterium P01_H01_bin.152]
MRDRLALIVEESMDSGFARVTHLQRYQNRMCAKKLAAPPVTTKLAIQSITMTTKPWSVVCALTLSLTMLACDRRQTPVAEQTTQVPPREVFVDLEVSSAQEAEPSPTPTASPTLSRAGFVASEFLNVRAAAGTEHEIRDRLPRGTAVEILKEQPLGDIVWYQIQLADAQIAQPLGWVFGPYVVGSLSEVPPVVSTVHNRDRPVQAADTATPSKQIYKEAYLAGYRDGRSALKDNSGYNPEGFIQLSSNLEAKYRQAYRAGFYAGFDDGYYGQPNQQEPDSLEPNQPLQESKPELEPESDTNPKQNTETI